MGDHVAQCLPPKRARAGAGAGVLACAALLSACSSSPGMLTRDELLDPQACAACHPDHVTDWAGSMHAYAAKDPVFLAMNKRGQRETNGALGNFCIKCHAPMAVLEGATADGLNLDAVPDKLKGVTCFFCHSAKGVDGSHNNPITLATDLVLVGPISDPFAKGRPHGAAHSALLDRDLAESATLCGSCHDIVTPHSAFIERTFAEWKGSAFSTQSGTTCSQCHMPQSTADRAVSTVPGSPLRRMHAHTFAGVDTALTAFPDVPRQTAQVQALLDSTMQTALCVEPFAGGARVSAIIDNVAAGHSFPSGSAQDRRLWVELVATAGGQVVYQSGVVADGVAVTSSTDPDLWLMRDCMFDDQGASVDMFWQAFGFEGNALPALTTFTISDPNFYQTHKQRFFPADGSPIPLPDQITMRARLQPMGYDVLDDLVKSGDLDPQFRAAMPVRQVGATLVWTPGTANRSYLDRVTGGQVSCISETNLNVQADKFPAPVRPHCSP